MHAVIVDIETVDLRFPTSRELDGSDAMNEAPDYSAAYVVLHTDAGLDGHGSRSRSGAVTSSPSRRRRDGRRSRGWSVAELVVDLGGFARHLQADRQLRWLGPTKGAIHLGTPPSSTPPGTSSARPSASRCGRSSRT